MKFGRNSNRRFAVKNKEIKQIIFSRKKNKKWIIIALVLVLTLSGGSVATVMILHKNSSRSEFTLPDNLAGLNFTEDMIAASGVTNVGITEEKENYEIQLAQAKLTYETSQSGAERAESDYNTTVEKAKSDLAALKSTYEDAKENLELFESSVGDGYFYASEDGTILRTMVRAEQALTSDAVVFVYSNPKELTVTVSVDQSDITKLTVGDSAYVQSSAGSGYTGVITAIDPVSSSDSRTSVIYSVTVQINVEDEEDSLSANESVTVVFGMTEEEIEQLQQRQSMQGGQTQS